MWIVVDLNNDNVFDIVDYIISISNVENIDVVLTLSSSLGIKLSYMYLYQVISELRNRGIQVRRGPLIIGDMVLIDSEVYKFRDANLIDIVWWLVYNKVIDEKEIIVNKEVININGYVLKRG